MRGPLVLIGPPGAGKSSCAEHLSRETGRSRIDVDERQWPLLRSHPDIAAVEPAGLLVAGDVAPGARRAYLTAVRERLTAGRGEATARRILEEAKARATIGLLETASVEAVLDLGAGHSIYEHLDLRARVQLALRGARVVLLLPCADVEAAVAVLAARLAAQGRAQAGPRLRSYVTHPSNHALAGEVLHTGDDTIAGLCARLSASRALNSPGWA